MCRAMVGKEIRSNVSSLFMSADLVAYLLKMAEIGMIPSDLIPDILRGYEEMRKNMQSNDFFKFVQPSASHIPQDAWKKMGFLPFEDGILLCIAISIAQMKRMTEAKEKQQQPSGIFFPMPQFGLKECKSCKAQNLLTAQHCMKCGNML